MPFPTRKGYAVTSVGSGTAVITVTPDGTLATGDWMVLTYVSASAVAPTVPDGWTILHAGVHVGTRYYMSWGKIRVLTDPSYTVTQLSSTNGAQVTLTWGSGGDAVSTWVVGSIYNRSATGFNTTCTSLTTASNYSLVLAIGMEASTTGESGITSITGATEWYFAPQGVSPIIHTTEVAYIEKTTAGATGDVTIVYPNTTPNGWGAQVAITASDTSAPISNSMFQIFDGTTANNTTATVWNGTSEVALATWTGEVATNSTPATPTAGLFFQMDYDGLHSSSKKVFSHYFTPYPTSVDNVAPASDYYYTGFMKVSGEGGIHAAYGGLLRDRPFPNAPRAGDYMLLNMRDECRLAYNAGLDGFFIDLLGITGYNWDRAVKLIDGCNAEFPGGEFKIVPMIDANGAHGGAAPATVSGNLMYFANKASSYYVPDGRFMVGSFNTAGETDAWWQSVFDYMRDNESTPCAFMAVYQNIASATSYDGHDYTYGSSNWGAGADPGIAINGTNYSTAVKARGEKWMSPCWPADIRPNASLYDETKGTGSVREYWHRIVREDADYVQMTTWNDHSEGGNFQPSPVKGHVPLDMSSYYMHEWKTGVVPTILIDAVYLSHRAQVMPMVVTDGQSTTMAQWNRGTYTSTTVNIVETVAYLTAPATVNVTIGSTTTTYSGVTGENVFQTAIGSDRGTVSVTVVRAGTTVASITSPVALQSSRYKDEPTYYMFSSLRGTTGQYDPNDH